MASLFVFLSFISHAASAIVADFTPLNSRLSEHYCEFFLFTGLFDRAFLALEEELSVVGEKCHPGLLSLRKQFEDTSKRVCSQVHWKDERAKETCLNKNPSCLREGIFRVHSLESVIDSHYHGCEAHYRDQLLGKTPAYDSRWNKLWGDFQDWLCPNVLHNVAAHFSELKCAMREECEQFKDQLCYNIAAITASIEEAKRLQPDFDSLSKYSPLENKSMSCAMEGEFYQYDDQQLKKCYQAVIDAYLEKQYEALRIAEKFHERCNALATDIRPCSR